MSNINTTRLFNASCMALTVTSMTFAMRAAMMKPVEAQFTLDGSQMGAIGGIAFFGFAGATVLGGFILDQIGMKRLAWVAFGAHLLGLLLTIFSSGFEMLYYSILTIGIANGLVEAVCNPLVSTLFPNNKTVMLNKFHVWFPGGIVIGALIASAMKAMHLDWPIQTAVVLIPTIMYGYMFLGQDFPKTERVASGVTTSQMFGAVFTPLFLFMAFCMFCTANTELSTTQWIDVLLGNAGADALLILALVNGIMACGRYFGGPLIHRFSPKGILLLSAAISILGLYLLRTMDGNALYLAAVVFAVGVCFFWPTMLGFVSENVPKSGALGLSIMGGVGMLGNWAFQTYYIGPRLEEKKQALEIGGMVKNQAELMAGREILSTINILPVILVLAFGALWLMSRKK